MGLSLSVVSAAGVTEQAESMFVHKHVGHGSTQTGKSGEREVVVIPVDGSKEAMYAFDWYKNNIHQHGNKLYVLHCWEVDQPSGDEYPDYAIPPEAWEDALRRGRENGLNILDKYEKKLKENKLDGTLRSVFGRPGHSIVDVADEYQANQIVMGSRGMGPVRRTVLGSVSHYVLHHSHIPVTVVPPPHQ